jgi:polar amino acid transport system substrate-binding protein
MRAALALLLAMALLPVAATAETLVIVTDGYRPVAYSQDGHPSGALCDVLVEAGRRAGIGIDIRFLPWARSMQETRTGRADAIFAVFHTPEREAYLAFSDEVLLGERMAWFSRKNSPLTLDGTLSALAGLRIGVINRSSYGRALDHILDVLTNVETVNDTTGALRILTAGRVDLVPGFDQGIWAEARELGVEDAIVEQTPPVDDVPAFLAFTRARDLSVESKALDAALRSMKEDGSYQKILERYFVTKPQ